MKLQSEKLQGAHVFQAYTGLQTADRLRQVRAMEARAACAQMPLAYQYCQRSSQLTVRR